MIIADLVRRSCQIYSSNVAVTDPTTSLTYGEVWERSIRLVNALRALGVLPGDRVATLGSNHATSLEEMTGLAVGGYARTALHGMNAGETHAYMLEHVGARVLIVRAEHYRKYRESFEAVPCLEHVIVHEGPAGTLDYEQLLASASAEDPHVPVSGDDVIHLAFSSGSSGKPKAATHTHGSWMHVTTDHVSMLPRLTEADVYLAAAPLTHAASTVLYGLLARGARIQVMPSFDAGEALRLVEEQRCSLTVMVPTMLQLLVAHPDVATRDLSSLRAVLYAGAPISVATARAAHAALGDVLYQTYGQSECLPATILTPEDHAVGVRENAALLRSAGRPCLNSTVRILDAEGGRDRDPYARSHARDLQRSPTDGVPGDRGRLHPHQGQRLSRRHRLPVRRGPHRRHDHLRRLQYLAGRDRERPGRASRSRGGLGGGGGSHEVG